METVKEKKIVDIGEWESFLREMTGNLEPYGHYDVGYGDAFDQIDDWLNAQPNLQDVPDTNVVDKWVSVDERLPITEKEALEYYEMNSEFPQFIVKIDVGVTAAVLEFNGKDWFDGYATYNVTHWMPFPEPPKAVK